MIRSVLERMSRGRVVRRRLPADAGGHALFVSPRKEIAASQAAAIRRGFRHPSRAGAIMVRQRRRDVETVFVHVGGDRAKSEARWMDYFGKAYGKPEEAKTGAIYLSLFQPYLKNELGHSQDEIDTWKGRGASVLYLLEKEDILGAFALEDERGVADIL